MNHTDIICYTLEFGKSPNTTPTATEIYFPHTFGNILQEKNTTQKHTCTNLCTKAKSLKCVVAHQTKITTALAHNNMSTYPRRNDLNASDRYVAAICSGDGIL